jgi:hypothetical protein
MKKKLVNSQLNNFATYQMYLRQCLTLAENVFEFPNMPIYIDLAYVNKVLLRKGAIAFFYDDVLEELLALPFTNYGKLDVYGRPLKIQVFGKNGYNRVLNKDEYVIMYDNNGQYPLFIDICQYAERIALTTRTTDINIGQQKTPRFWKTSTEKELSLKRLVENVDGYEETILTYEDINFDDTSLVLAPAPFVADKLDIHKEKEWNEFLRLIGIANMNFQKKERNIKDEVLASQGGTIASRWSRFQPRQNAVDKINEKFKDYLDGKKLEVKYYDGIPTSTEEKEVEENDESVLLDTNIDA